MTRFVACVIALLAGVLPALAKPSTSTLAEVRARGAVLCGVGSGVPGFAEVDDKGHWSGFEVDICHAIAGAIFGRRDAVKFRPVTASERFAALESGEIDVLMRATTWTLPRDTENGLRFVLPMVYDGHKLLVRRSQAVSSVLELSGISICVEAGSPAEQAVIDFFSLRRMRYDLVSAQRIDDAVRAYAARGCKALAAAGSQLAAIRNRIDAPNEHVLLPENISREPLGPMVRQADEQWFSIVRWVVHALVAAEDLGITASNADQQRILGSTEARRLLGGEATLGPSLGLDAGWALQAIKVVGNYGEIFERNLGSRSALKLERGLNNLWNRNGLMMAPPFR